MSIDSLDTKLDHLFRYESGKMVAVLLKIFGSQHLELAEDVVQNTLLKAFENWKFNGIPENPTAWLYRVAKNQAIDILRKENKSTLFDFSEPDQQLLQSGYTISEAMNSFWESEQIKDDFLGMMFACCQSDLSAESQITFILKTLCGFDAKEVAKAFLTTEDIISKRVYRTKEYFRKRNIRPSLDSIVNIDKKIATVASSIYLIFNEGYSSTDSAELIRQDLISQALYLTRELLDHPKTNLPEVNALMALMCFHTARVRSRISKDGHIVLLKDQDRSLWNKEIIDFGRFYLSNSSSGNRISYYHFEALIAYEHCMARTYDETNWKRILEHYEKMLALKYDPVIHLNKSLVVLQLKGEKEALQDLLMLEKDKAILKYYLYHSALGEVYSNLGNKKQAKNSYQKALELTKSEKEKDLMQKKINELFL